ncbi:MAG: hypothetical protein KDA63_11585, partial [Planctomycetales bacterium]|nr:hypothetical protein [Planctomycetales bacterium]
MSLTNGDDASSVGSSLVWGTPRIESDFVAAPASARFSTAIVGSSALLPGATAGASPTVAEARSEVTTVGCS